MIKITHNTMTIYDMNLYQVCFRPTKKPYPKLRELSVGDFQQYWDDRILSDATRHSSGLIISNSLVGKVEFERGKLFLTPSRINFYRSNLNVENYFQPPLE